MSACGPNPRTLRHQRQPHLLSERGTSVPIYERGTSDLSPRGQGTLNTARHLGTTTIFWVGGWDAVHFRIAISLLTLLPEPPEPTAHTEPPERPHYFFPCCLRGMPCIATTPNKIESHHTCHNDQQNKTALIYLPTPSNPPTLFLE